MAAFKSFGDMMVTYKLTDVIDPRLWPKYTAGLPSAPGLRRPVFPDDSHVRAKNPDAFRGIPLSMALVIEEIDDAQRAGFRIGHGEANYSLFSALVDDEKLWQTFQWNQSRRQFSVRINGVDIFRGRDHQEDPLKLVIEDINWWTNRRIEP